MPLIQAHKDIRILIDEDHDLSDIAEDFIGRKAYSLFKLRDMDVPVPPFFAISSSVFTEYIHDALGEPLSKQTSDDELRERILNGEFSLQLRNEVMEGYSRLSGFTDSWVAVRSSAVFPEGHRHLSFAGLLDTVLNVKGLDNVLKAIQQVYASLFTSKVLAYLSDFNLGIADIKVAIVVQKMVQAEASGVVFTVDPISQDENFLTIEAVFGLGDVIARGDITPDQYIIDKKTLKFKEKKILPQEWMMVRNVKKRTEESPDQKVQISKSWQYQQKLENRYVMELSKIAVVVEKKAKEPQDIEWVFEGGRLWLLQCTGVQHIELPRSIEEVELEISPALVTAAQEIAQKEEMRQTVKEAIEREKKHKIVEPTGTADATGAGIPVDAGQIASSEITEKIAPVETPVPEDPVFSEKPLTRQILQGVRYSPEVPQMVPDLQTRIEPLPGERLFLTGIGASTASLRGTVQVISNKDQIREYSEKINKETVLVIPEHLEGIDTLVNKAGAVIVDTGGMTSDLATRCREQRIPCIMGTHIASRMLKTGEVLLVDGAVGAVYGVRDISAGYRTAAEVKPEAVPRAVESAVPEEFVPAETASVEPSQGPAVPTPEPEVLKVPQNETPSPTPQNVQIEPEAPIIKTATKLFLNATDIRSENAIVSSLPASDGICVLPIESLYSRPSIGKHPEAMIEDGKRNELIDALKVEISKTAESAREKPIILSIGNQTVGEYKELGNGASFEEIDIGDLAQTSRGLVRLLHHPKEIGAVLKAIRRVRNVDGWRTVSLALDYAATPGYVAEFKKLLSTAGIRRSATFKLYLTISTPSEAMIVDEFIKTGIDGIIIDTPHLARQMMALTPDDSSVVKVIEAITTAARGMQMILILPKENGTLLKQVFEMGFYGIAVSGGELKEVREKVAGMEADRVFRR